MKGGTKMYYVVYADKRKAFDNLEDAVRYASKRPGAIIVDDDNDEIFDQT